MTALMHCAYHGNNDACTLLLERGADVNSNAQQNGVWHCLSSLFNIPLYLFHFCLQYTALMFATIAGQSELVPNYNIIAKFITFVSIKGHKDTVLLLLHAGARRSTVNNMGKNVMQLGSFVGVFSCCCD